MHGKQYRSCPNWCCKSVTGEHACCCLRIFEHTILFENTGQEMSSHVADRHLQLADYSNICTTKMSTGKRSGVVQHHFMLGNICLDPTTVRHMSWQDFVSSGCSSTVVGISGSHCVTSSAVVLPQVWSTSATGIGVGEVVMVVRML